VHSKNKAQVRAQFGERFIRVADSKRRNVLVLGDSVGDAFAAGPPSDIQHTVAIGFYDVERTFRQPQEKYEEVYDLLLPATSGFEWLAHALNAR